MSDVRMDAVRVSAIFQDCLYENDEDQANHVEVKGITLAVNFEPTRLESHRTEIEGMLDQLPDDFKKDGGKGGSFLLFGRDKNGDDWSSLQLIMEKLLLLGLAIKKAVIVAPREMWSILPGGVPYIMIN